MKAFLLKSTILTIIIFTVGLALYSTVLEEYYLSILPVAVVFFFVVTNLVHGYLLRIAVKSGNKFTSYYMAVSFLKMFFYLAVGIIYVLFNRAETKTFLINFLILYLLFSFLEVFEFSKIVKQKV